MKTTPRAVILMTARIIAMLVLLVITLLPLFWIVSTAFRPDSEVTQLPVTFLPQEWTLQNFKELFASGNLRFLANSLIATIGSTILVLMFAVPAGYAVSRHQFPFKIGNIVGGSTLGARFIPPFVLIIPLFLFMKSLNLLDTPTVLVILYTAMNLPLAIWIIMPAVRQLPSEIIEAASVDGAGVFRTFFSVIVPLLKPAIATAACLSAIFAWNEFFSALIFTQVKGQTLPLLISTFVGDFGIKWGLLAANALFAALPIVLLGVFAQKFLVRGLTAGAVK